MQGWIHLQALHTGSLTNSLTTLCTTVSHCYSWWCLIHIFKMKCKYHTSIYTKLSHPYIQYADNALFHICKIYSSIYTKYGCICHLLPYMQNYLIHIFKTMVFVQQCTHFQVAFRSDRTFCEELFLKLRFVFQCHTNNLFCR